MNHAAAGTRFVRETRWAHRAAIAITMGAAAFAACAQDAVPADAGLAQAASAATAAEAPLRLELSASERPRLDSTESSAGNPRIDLSLLPATRSAVGLAVGMSGLSSPSPTSLAGANVPGPALDLGLHMRHTLESNHRIDVTAWRRVNSQPDAYTLIQMQQPRYGARVEMNLKPQRKGLLADRGFVGLQLEGGGRISVRRKHGGPMFYYRNTF
jgi:hypothetical protein